MKKIYLLLILLSFQNISKAQTFEWVTGQDIDYEFNPGMLNYVVAVTDEEVVWLAGMKEFIEFYNEAMGDQFLKAYDSDGNLLHDYTVGGSALVSDMETDADGNIYLAGEYKSDLQFPDNTVLKFAGPFINSFLVKLTPQGMTDWAVNLETLHPGAVAGDVLVQGDRLYVANSEWLESSILEFDLEGNELDSIIQSAVGLVTSIALDEDGNLYATGSCPNAGSTFGEVPYTSPFPYSIYLVKYNPDRIPEWVHFVEDVTCIQPEVTVDTDGNVIWAGGLNIGSTFDTLTFEGPEWVYDFFVTKFNPQGNIQWGLEVPQVMTGDASVGKLSSLAIMADNSICLGGFQRGTIDWGNGVVSGSTGFANDLLVLNISPEGVVEWSKTGGGTGSEVIMATAGNHGGSLYSTGIGHETILFDTCSFTGQSFYYPYLVKLNTGIMTGIDEPYPALNNLKVFPNPAQRYINIPIGPDLVKDMQVFKADGRMVLKTANANRIDISGYAPGVYLLRLVTTEGSATSQFIISR